MWLPEDFIHSNILPDQDEKETLAIDDESAVGGTTQDCLDPSVPGPLVKLSTRFRTPKINFGGPLDLCPSYLIWPHLNKSLSTFDH